MPPTPAATARDIVAEDFRTAAVFQKYGIAFCCGGDRQLAAPCRERSIAPDACTTDRGCLEELRAFEEDLHMPVHLESNILFPKARALDAARRTPA